MGAITWSIPHELALGLAALCNVYSFVETGTFEGTTAFWACDHFDRVFTIEGDPDRAQQLLKAFMPWPQRLTFVHGNSGHELNDVLGQIAAPCLLWLDAHWTGHAEHPPVNGIECPVVEELKAVNLCSQAAYHAIMIDDANFFTTPGRITNYRDWPTLDAIMRELVRFDRYIFITKDVICAVPGKYKDAVRDWVVTGV